MGRAERMPEPTIAVLDVDGTLVDSNYQHAMAWYRALRSLDEIFPVWRLHRLIGMGGDQLVPALAGEEAEKEKGDEIRAAEKALYLSMIYEVRPLPNARRFLEVLKENGHVIVLASSAKKREVDHYLDLLDARGLADDWTSSADVQCSRRKKGSRS